MSMRRNVFLATSAAAVFTLGSTGAWAQCEGASSPNPNVVFEAGATTTDHEIVGGLNFKGDGQAKADVKVTTTTECLAMNTKSDREIPGQSTIDSSSETLEDVKVCQQSGGTLEPTAIGELAGLTTADCNP